MKNYFIPIIIFIILIFSNFETKAQDRWNYVCKTKVFDCYYDSFTIEKNGSSVAIWIRYSFFEPKYDKIENKYVKESIYKKTFYCGLKKVKLVEGIDYYIDNSNHSFDNEEYGKLETIIPGSVNEEISNIICN